MNIIRLSWSSYQTEESLQQEAETLRSEGHQYLRPTEAGPRPQKLKTYDAVIVNSQFEVNRSFLNQLTPDTLVLTASSGFNHIDLESCTENGVTVGRTPLCRAINVSDYVRSALRLLKRDIHRTGHPVRKSFWSRAEAYENISSFSDGSLGIFGFGVIGRKLLDHLDAFDFEQILAYDPLQRADIENHDDVTYAPARTFFESSDVITVHADLNPTTRGLIDDDLLSVMKDSACLINSSRGAIVNLQDLLSALKNDSLDGAILDVLPEEPPSNPDTFTEEGLIVTPHSAGFGPDLLDDLTDEIVRMINQFDRDEALDYPVKPRSKRELDRLSIRPGEWG